jgi:phosphate:Na+ symporter
VRQVPLGNLMFKVIGVVIAAPLVGLWVECARPYVQNIAALVVLFHLSFNLLVATLFISLTQVVAKWVY